MLKSGKPKNCQLLQTIDGHVFKLDLFGTVGIASIGQNADGHAWTGDIGKPRKKH
jgi:hypothetical protein